MDTILAYLLFAVAAVVLIGTVGFAIWAVQYFARKNWRYLRRRNQYVPVSAEVTRSLEHRRCATVFVTYEHDGQVIQNRFLVSRHRGWVAPRVGRITLHIDPKHPRDVELRTRA